MICICTLPPLPMALFWRRYMSHCSLHIHYFTCQYHHLNKSHSIIQVQLEVMSRSPLRRAFREDWFLSCQGKIVSGSKISFITCHFTCTIWGITLPLAKYWSHISALIQSYKQMLSNLNSYARALQKYFW